MRAITKGEEPRSLTEHRLTAHSNYDNYQDKDSLRTALAGEQRGLCCYCMGRIYPEHTKMKIAHWQCQAKYPESQLDYTNLLGACLGGQGSPRKYEHCDTRQGEDDIRWNPANPAHQIESRVKYDLDGTIRSDDAVFDGQLNDVLNLNLEWLKNNRKAVLTSLVDWWRAVRKPLPPGRIEREIRTRTDGVSLQPYCHVAVWWLRKRP